MKVRDEGTNGCDLKYWLIISLFKRVLLVNPGLVILISELICWGFNTWRECEGVIGNLPV